MEKKSTFDALDPKQFSSEDLISWVKEVHNPDANPEGYDLEKPEDRQRFIADNFRKK